MGRTINQWSHRPHNTRQKPYFTICDPVSWSNITSLHTNTKTKSYTQMMVEPIVTACIILEARSQNALFKKVGKTENNSRSRCRLDVILYSASQLKIRYRGTLVQIYTTAFCGSLCFIFVQPHLSALAGSAAEGGRTAGDRISWLVPSFWAVATRRRDSQRLIPIAW